MSLYVLSLDSLSDLKFVVSLAAVSVLKVEALSEASYSTTIDWNHWTLRIIRIEFSIMVFSYARLLLIRYYCSRGYMYI